MILDLTCFALCRVYTIERKPNMNSKIFYVITIFLTANMSVAQETKVVNSQTMYQIDIFSLVSFGLTITSIILSFFFGILSLFFYKLSASSTEKSIESVSRIETAINGIQSNISAIIDKAVEQWVGSSSSQADATQEHFDKTVSEIENFVKDKSPEEDKSDILLQISDLKTQMDNFVRDTRMNQARFFLSPISRTSGTDLIQVNQTNNIANDELATGIINIKITRPTHLATATIHFSPKLKNIPTIETKLLMSPYTNPKEISAKPGSPSTMGCNFHLNAKDLLLAGEYVVEYTAKVTM